MVEPAENEASVPVPPDVVLCIDPEVYARLRSILRHLCVGMIDFNAAVRLATPSPEVGALTLGPIQMVTYDPPLWPARVVAASRRRRLAPLLEKLAERAPSVVHAVSRGSFEVGAAIAERFDIDLIVQLTSLDDVPALAPSFTARASHYIPCSHPIRDAMEKQIEVPSDRVSLIHPGVLAGSEPTCFSRPDHVPTILCTAGFKPGSGMNRLLTAARILRDQPREFLMFLTGSGPREAELRKQARQLALNSSVIFARPTGGAESMMIGADLYVDPAPQPALTASPLYAMANGMAVVAVEGGAADIFIDGITALVCPDGDPATLAEAIGRLLADRDLATQLAQAAVNHMKTHHAISVMVEETMKIYRELALRRTTFSLGPQAPGSLTGHLEG